MHLTRASQKGHPKFFGGSKTRSKNFWGSISTCRKCRGGIYRRHLWSSRVVGSQSDARKKLSEKFLRKYFDMIASDWSAWPWHFKEHTLNSQLKFFGGSKTRSENFWGSVSTCRKCWGGIYRRHLWSSLVEGSQSEARKKLSEKFLRKYFDMIASDCCTWPRHFKERTLNRRLKFFGRSKMRSENFRGSVFTCHKYLGGYLS